jgi:hypothetical protein
MNIQSKDSQTTVVTGMERLSAPLPVMRQLLRLLHFDEIFEITP